MKKFLILILFILPLSGFGQMLDPTKWKVSTSKQEVKVGETVEIIFSVTMTENYHFYGLGENPPQAYFTFDGSGFEKVGNMKEGPGLIEKYDENLEANVKYFSHKAEFRQKVKITKTNPVINVEVEGQACPDGPGQCVRVNKSFEIKDLKVTAAAVPTPKTQENKAQNNTPAPTAKETQKINTNNDKLGDLEKQKAKLVTKDSKGNDETVQYLKNFSNKYGKQ